MTSSDGRIGVEALLAERRPFLLALVRRRASRIVLAMESPEDLVQDVCAHLLGPAADAWPADPAAVEPWLTRLASNFLNDRNDHYRALKRDGVRVLRHAFSDDADQELSWFRDVAASVTGPSTLAARREQVHLATRALDALLERDRWLIQRLCQGSTAKEDGEALGLKLESVHQARSRAMERLRRAFRIAARGMDGMS